MERHAGREPRLRPYTGLFDAAIGLAALAGPPGPRGETPIGETRDEPSGAVRSLMCARLPSPHVMLGLAAATLGTAWGSILASWQVDAAGLPWAWSAMALSAAAAMPAAIIHIAGRLLLDQRREARDADAQAVFRRFQPPILADQIAARPDFLARPIRQQAAVLFIDLSQFTALSERLGPECTRDLLGEFHAIIEDVATRHDGVVLSYMGDGAMIVFGLPRPHRHDAGHALAAAIELAGRVRSWLDARAWRIEHGLGVRIGGHYGPVVVSRLGAEMHQHIAATGDTVNVASRLLAVADANRALVALSADLVEAAACEADPVRDSAPAEQRVITIRGRSQPLAVRLWRRVDAHDA